MRLVQMKSVARAEPERPALEVAPEDWVETLCDEKKSTQPKQAQKWNAKKLNTLATSFAELPHWEASLAANQMVNQFG